MVSGLCLFSFLLFVSFILILLPPYFISRLVYSFISLLFYWSLTSSSFLASYINDFLFLSLFIIFIHYCFYFWGGIPFFFLVSWVETLLVFRLVSGKVLAGDRVVWRVWWRNYLQRCGHLYPPWAWRGRAAVTEGQGDTWSNAPLSDIPGAGTLRVGLSDAAHRGIFSVPKQHGEGERECTKNQQKTFSTFPSPP